MSAVSSFDVNTPITMPARIQIPLPRLCIEINTGEPFQWLSRPRRVLLILASVWIINLLDLGYTLSEALHVSFRELNPLAAMLIGKNPDLLIGYKLGLLTLSSSILLFYSRHRISEIGCWFLLCVYLGVAIRWSMYYEHRIACFADPAINVDPILGRCIP